ncbi:hypothetical protein MNBD_GAMMA21-2088 [hydrothermal vent metagenome]|uniref:Uncharacterized protein n=1 Tax=hydrothermal vent metagenome TaxID=652676 RepID=A0A3B1AEK5_9ZZZZ
MIGKKNIVFGFLYLVVTASLGPFMVVSSAGDIEAAYVSKQSPVGRVQDLKTNDFEEELEPLNAEQIAKANTDAILSMNNIINLQTPHGNIRSTHAHGNLEAILNILAGLALCFIAVAKIFKQIISWCFIAGALLHSGMLYIGIVFEQSWAFTLLQAGPWVVLAGLLLAGIAALIGFKGEIVQDN